MISFYVNSTPTSVNQLYKRSKHGGIYINQKALDFKKLIKEELDKCIFQMSSNKLRVEIVYFVKKQKIDIDNLNKVVLDSMNKIVYEDDSQIYELLCRKELSAVPRTVITVTELF